MVTESRREQEKDTEHERGKAREKTARYVDRETESMRER